MVPEVTDAPDWQTQIYFLDHAENYIDIGMPLGIAN